MTEMPGSGSADDGVPDAPADSAMQTTAEAKSPDGEVFTSLLQYLKNNRGLDLSGYKPASLRRRIDKRLTAIGARDYHAFIEYLEANPEEFEALFDELLINVTGFFRDPEAWGELSTQVVGPMLRRQGSNNAVRVWSAGCASGEEAYTLAIVLAEALGADAFKARVKIYATDADDSALVQARQGIYDERQMGSLSSQLRDRYFDRTKDGRFAFRADLRRALIFGRHDLMFDAPISRIDILSCRNVLMYFNAEMQIRILHRFAIALAENGVLFLGRAETLLSRTTLFVPIDLKQRIFTRARAVTIGERAYSLVREGPRIQRDVDGQPTTRLRNAALDSGPVAQVVVDADRRVMAANQVARTLLGLSPSDLGRPLQDLELSYRPLELRSRLDELYRTKRAMSVTGVAWVTQGNAGGSCDVILTPLSDEMGTFLGANISFVDTSAHSRLQRELQHANEELETAYEELQSTNEELETTNEELQSAVEELETTNEELQSTNEELETMNEELQSTNQELQAINDAMQGREADLDEASAFLRSILSSLRSGVIALDRELRVTAWSDRATDLWGARADEVLERNVFTLDIGLPMETLHAPLRACLAGETGRERLTIAAINRRGKSIVCEVLCYPLRRDDDVRGVLILMDEMHAATAD